MKNIVFVLWLALIFFFPSQSVLASKILPEAGSIETYKSANGKWSVDITNKGCPQDSSSDCAFFEGGHLQWQREIPLTPGKVLVADNGRSIVMTRWGCYDEDGAKGVLFYNKEGDLLKEAAFSDDPDKGSLLWMDAFVMAADGSYCVVASHWRDRGEARLRLYNCLTGDLVWRRSYILEREIIEPVQVMIANEGRMILVAAYNYSTADMAYFVLNKQGDILWQDSVYKNFCWDKNDYIHMEEKGFYFEVFDRAKNCYRHFELEDGRVQEKTL